jgi:hypothetical protein
MLKEIGFKGLDLSQPAELLRPGYLTKADEVILEAGQLAPVPALTSQLASSLTGSAYALTPFRSGSTNYALFVNNAKLYRWQDGTTTKTEILDGLSSLTVASASAFMTTLSGYAYLVDGAASLRRVSLSGSSVASGLDAPSAPAAGRTRREIGAAASTWLQQTAVDDTNLIPEAYANFDDGGAFWTLTGGTTSNLISEANGDPCATLDSQNEGFHTPVLVLPTGCRVIQWECEIAARHGEIGNPNECLDMQVIAYSDTGGTTAISGGTVTKRTEFASLSPTVKVRMVFDFRNLSTAPLSVKVSGYQPFDRPTGTANGKGTNVNRCRLIPMSQNFTTAGSVVVSQGGVAVSDSIVFSRDLYLITTLGAAIDLRGRNRVVLALTAAPGVLSIPARLVFYNGGNLGSGGTKQVSTPLVWDVATGYATAEIGAVAANLSDVRQWGIEFTADWTVPGIQASGTSELVTIGALSESGNLLSEAGVFYRLVAVDATADGTNLLNVLQSDGSRPSAVIETTLAESMCVVTIPSSFPSGTTRWKLFRFGGGLPDGEGRLVLYLATGDATFAYGADAAKGASPFYAQLANPYVSWNATSKEILDNTPDEWLVGSERFISGRELPPSAPVEVAAWRGRVWLGKGQEIYASWLVDADTNAGLYWTRLGSAQGDAEGRLKGWYRLLGLDAGDTIQRIIPLKSVLVVLCQWSVWVVTGSEPGSFDVRKVELREQLGIYARRAATVIDDVLYFLSQDGLYTFDGSRAQRVSDMIRGTSEDSGLVPTTSACMTYAAEKIYLSSSGDTWIYHLPQETEWRGWTKRSATFVDAIRLNGVLVAAIGTNLYKLGGASGASCVVKTRTVGDGVKVLIPGYLRGSLKTAASATFSVAAGRPGSLISKSYGLATGENHLRVSMPRNSRSSRYQVQVSLSSASDWRLRSLYLEFGDGGFER